MTPRSRPSTGPRRPSAPATVTDPRRPTNHPTPRRPARSTDGATPTSLRRASTLVAACVALLTVGVAPASAAKRCPFADAQPGTVGTARTATALGCLVDHERTAAGLPPLPVDERVRLAASRHATDMARRTYFDHVAPAPAPFGATVGDRLSATGFAWSSTGENIARGQETPRAVMKAWLQSTGHCQNLMNPAFTVAGHGVSALRGGPYWVQVFVLPAGVPVASGPPVACPRLPAVPAPSGLPADTRATAKRTRRMLAVGVTPPPGVGRTTLVVRVQQRGRTVRTLRRRVSGPGEERLAIKLPAARGGRLLVRAGPTPTVAVAFR